METGDINLSFYTPWFYRIDYQPEPFFALPAAMWPSAVALLMIAAILLPEASAPVAIYLPDFTSIPGLTVGTFFVFVFTE